MTRWTNSVGLDSLAAGTTARPRAVGAGNGGASAYTAAGNVRVNGTRQTRSSARIRVGDTLTFALHGHVRVVEIIALSARRGPAVEARALYHDHEPPENRSKTPSETKLAQRSPGSGRPTKRERRAQDAFTDKGSFRG